MSRRPGARVSIVLVAAFVAGCSGPEKPTEERTPVQISGAPQTFTAAPFQQSALTLVGHGARVTASTFERLSSSIAMRQGAIEQLELSVELASVVGSDRKALAELRSPDGFGGPSAVASFRSTRIVPGPNGQVTAIGLLALRGRTHEVRVPLTVRHAADAIEVDVKATLAPADWQRAFGRQHAAVFTERIEVLARIVYPRSRVASPGGVP